MSDRRVVVVGAGVVGLCTAWFLREAGARVTVIDREGVAAGASFGNAGWIMPARAVPITGPSSIREGMAGLFDRDGAFRIASWSRPSTWRFLARFAWNSTPRRSAHARTAMAALNDASLDAFDALEAEGIPAPVRASIVAAFATGREAAHLAAGDDLEHVDADEARRLFPHLGAGVGAVVRMNGTRYVEPAAFTQALGTALTHTGVVFETGEAVEVLRGPRLVLRDRIIDADDVVLATGARLGSTARRLGVSVPIAAGRGYSFFAPTDRPVPAPIYLPTERLACTPAAGGIRIAGMMEITVPDAVSSSDRFESMAGGAARLLTGVRLGERSGEWRGDRPLTADGLPLIGPTAIDGVHLAGGHGMWGVTQGAATGRLLTEAILTGRVPAALAPLSPLR